MYTNICIVCRIKRSITVVLAEYSPARWAALERPCTATSSSKQLQCYPRSFEYVFRRAMRNRRHLSRVVEVGDHCVLQLFIHAIQWKTHVNQVQTPPVVLQRLQAEETSLGVQRKRIESLLPCPGHCLCWYYRNIAQPTVRHDGSTTKGK